MSRRLIDVDEFVLECLSNYTDYKKICIDDLRRLLLSTPTVDVEPVKHGHWVDDGTSIWRCSVCNDLSCTKGNYCSHCGAKMEEE